LLRNVHASHGSFEDRFYFAYPEVYISSLPEGTSVDSLLTQLADELLVQDITEPSAVLGSLSDDELQVFYDFVLEQFALELLIGLHENSESSEGKLVIAGNRGRIHLLQAAFYAVKLEAQRRIQQELGAAQRSRAINKRNKTGLAAFFVVPVLAHNSSSGSKPSNANKERLRSKLLAWLIRSEITSL
jgi:hypothetical protein